MSTSDPRIHLSLDTCFAKKRWPMPEDWAPVVRDLGVRYVELSADTEADPMYHGEAYLARWDARVMAACEKHGLAVGSLYSGHGSYTTMGLLHPDPEIVQRMLTLWVQATLKRAAAYGAEFGFFFHAIAEADLQDPSRYAARLRDLENRLVQVATMAAEAGARAGLEQMYSPNQPPWTISGAEQLLAGVLKRAGAPLYLTIDTGHASGQRQFSGAVPADSDPYAWIRALGTVSPIVHLQQTDGLRSAHWPFTAERNAQGIIRPQKLLTALSEAWAERGARPGLPPAVEDIYLTLEMFAGTAQSSDQLLDEISASVAYWREAIPRDGMRLSELVRS